MASRHTKIFLSYRRMDARSDARSLRRELERTFSPDEVFRDIEDVELGQGVSGIIKEQIENAETVLVLIGPNWLRITALGGVRRIDQPDDYIRIEIETALSLRKRIIPVYIEETPQLKPADLPRGIQELADLNSHRLRDATYEADILRLVSALPGTELTIGRVVGGAALGGFLCDVIVPWIRYGLISPGGSRSGPEPILAIPLLEAVRYGVCAVCVFGALRGVLRLSSFRIGVASGWIALAALVGELAGATINSLLRWIVALESRFPIYYVGSLVSFVILGFGGCQAFLRARGKSSLPIRQTVMALAVCGAIAAIPSICVKYFLPSAFPRESVLPFALTSAFYKALTVAGLLTAAGGLQAWGRSFVMGIVVVAGLGAFVGNVMVQIYRWAIYYNRDITGTFDPQLVFVYAAISLAIFILLGKKFSGNQRILYHPAFARIGILVALICLPLAFWLKPKGFGEPIQDQLRRRIESRVDSLLDKLMEKGVISKKEVDELR